MERDGLTIISLRDKDADGNVIPLAEIDPFTFATFNRKITDEKRKRNWQYLKNQWGLTSPVPEDFAGIPVLHPTSSWFFSTVAERDSKHVALLWEIAHRAVYGDIQNLEAELFNRCLQLKKVGIASLTMGFFWLNPGKFLPADQRTLE